MKFMSPDTCQNPSSDQQALRYKAGDMAFVDALGSGDIGNRLSFEVLFTPDNAFYPIGYFHIDIAEILTEEGRLYLFVAIDRTSKFTYAELHDRATRRIAADFRKSVKDKPPVEKPASDLA